ncbi:MAG: endolytic transglycosylase MltG [Micrococcales bacterium]
MNSEDFPKRARHRRRSTAKLWFASLAIITVVAAGVGFAERSAVSNLLDSLFANDYHGQGTGSVNIVVQDGDTGEDVANTLAQAGVVKDFKTVYKTILKLNPTFYPGTFAMHLQMNSVEAVNLLASGENRVIQKVTVKEGLRISNVLKVLSEATGISRDEFTAAAKDLEGIGVPTGEVSAEGWLFPATYEFDGATTAKSMLATMVSRMKQELNDQGVAEAKWHETLTLASIVQKEARIETDFYKVSRVFLNRIKSGMPLQSDATVSYGSGGTTVTTTDAERADQNGYNTYVHLGLPVGPISAPGAVAIKAALNPAKGDWLFFCAINLKTGETVFSKTLAEHEKAVAQFQRWIQANPGWNG